MFRSLIYNYNVILIFFVIIPSKNLPKKFYQDFILEGKVEEILSRFYIGGKSWEIWDNHPGNINIV